jgi:hypothetical protein
MFEEAPDFEARGNIRRWAEGLDAISSQANSAFKKAANLTAERLWCGRRFTPEEVEKIVKMVPTENVVAGYRAPGAAAMLELQPDAINVGNVPIEGCFSLRGIRLRIDRRRIEMRGLSYRPVVFLRHCQERMFRRGSVRGQNEFMEMAAKAISSVRPFFRMRYARGQFTDFDNALPVFAATEDGVFFGRRRLLFSGNSGVKGTLYQFTGRPAKEVESFASLRCREDISDAPSHEFTVHFQTFVDWDAIGGVRESLAREALKILEKVPNEESQDWWFAEKGRQATHIAQAIDKAADDLVSLMNEPSLFAAAQQMRGSDAPGWAEDTAEGLELMAPSKYKVLEKHAEEFQGGDAIGPKTALSGP